MSDKFGEGRDPYLYPGLDIMRNRAEHPPAAAAGTGRLRNDGAACCDH